MVQFRMADEDPTIHVNRQLLALRIRYKDRSAADSRVTSVAFDAEHTTVREAIEIACPKFGITKPEMYGFAYAANLASPKAGSPKSAQPATSQRPPTSPKISSQYATLRKKSIRDDTEWIQEAITLKEAGLQSQVPRPVLHVLVQVGTHNDFRSDPHPPFLSYYFWNSFHVGRASCVS